MKAEDKKIQEKELVEFNDDDEEAPEPLDEEIVEREIADEMALKAKLEARHHHDESGKKNFFASEILALKL